jgi:hypothetical protein
VKRAGAASAVIAALATTSLGCLQPVVPRPTGGEVYQGTTDPAQYRSALPRDYGGAKKKPRAAVGEACQYSFNLPPNPPTPFPGSDVVVSNLPLKRSFTILAGDAGFATAVENARQSVQGAPIYDVRADMHTTMVLSIVRRDCLEIHASAPPAK